MAAQAQRRQLIDLFLWALVVVMTLLVVYTSVSAPGDGSVPVSDKLMHFLAYTGLTTSILLAAVWAPVRGEGRFPAAPLLIVVIASLFGFGIEVFQGPIPGRDAELLDALSNTAGAIAALGIWSLWRSSVEPPRSAG